MPPSTKPPTDHKLPHRIQDWARAHKHGEQPSERDADAVVSWLRGQRSSEYARKPADGLRRQVVRTIERMRAEHADAAAAPAAAAEPGAPRLDSRERLR